MLKLLATISPVLVLLLGLLGGGTLIGGLGWAYNVYFDNPQVAREATNRANDACTIRTMDAANRAEEAERNRQQRVSADVLAAYRSAADAQARLRQVAEDQLDQEIADHEREIRESGRSFIVTDDDFDRMRGKPRAAAEGGG